MLKSSPEKKHANNINRFSVHSSDILGLHTIVQVREGILRCSIDSDLDIDICRLRQQLPDRWQDLRSVLMDKALHFVDQIGKNYAKEDLLHYLCQ